MIAADVSGEEQRTASEGGPALIPCRADVSVEDEVVEMVRLAVAVSGRLDVLCNVAGIFRLSRMTDVSMHDYDRTMDVNLRGVLLGMKHALPALIDGGDGSIVNIASVTAMGGSHRGTSVYSASKAGVIALARSAACEHGPDNVRVNAICPGFIETPMSASGAATSGVGDLDHARLWVAPVGPTRWHLSPRSSPRTWRAM